MTLNGRKTIGPEITIANKTLSVVSPQIQNAIMDDTWTRDETSLRGDPMTDIRGTNQVFSNDS